MRLELTREGLLVELVSHLTTRDALFVFIIVSFNSLYMIFILLEEFIIGRDALLNVSVVEDVKKCQCRC